MSVFKTGVSRTDGLRTTMLAAALVHYTCALQHYEWRRETVCPVV